MPAATAPIQTLAWEPPYAVRVALKSKKQKAKSKKKKTKLGLFTVAKQKRNLPGIKRKIEN